MITVLTTSPRGGTENNCRYKGNEINLFQHGTTADNTADETGTL